MSLPEREPFRVELPLRHRDLDTLGHLNQAVYHELPEEVRSAFLREVLPDLPPTGYVLARVELDYRSEVRRDHGHVDVVVRVASVARSSIVMTHSVLLPDGTVAAEGQSILVAWDMVTRASKPLTGQQRALLGAS